MVKKKKAASKKKPKSTKQSSKPIFEDPFSSDEEILTDFFTGGKENANSKKTAKTKNTKKQSKDELTEVVSEEQAQASQEPATTENPEPTSADNLGPAGPEPTPADPEPEPVQEKPATPPAAEEYVSKPAESPEPPPPPVNEKEIKERSRHMEIFINEMTENIDLIDNALLVLENVPSSKDEINLVFRLIHNLKGISNSLNLPRVERLCHTVETALTYYRESGDPIPNEIVDRFFEFNDMLRSFKKNLEDTGEEGDVEPDELIRIITEVRAREEAPPEPVPQPPPTAEAPPQTPPMDDERREMLESYMPDFLQEYGEQIEALDAATLKLEQDPSDMDQVNDSFRQIHTLKGSSNALGFMTLGSLCHKTESTLAVFRESKKPLPKTLLDILFEFIDMLRHFKTNLEGGYTEGNIEIGSITARLEAVLSAPAEETVKESAPPQTPHEDKPAAPAATASIQSLSEKISTIRVNVNRLDNLMNSVGELVLLRNRYNQLSHQLMYDGDREGLIEEFNNLASQLDMTTGVLQEAVMRTRMLPVGNIFSKFNRVVRDLSRSLDKEVDLLISGADTELDKNLIEAISDPLMHCVRNCIDHGIEKPDERTNSGKGRRGTVGLNAFQEGNSIIIEIMDDGRGIDGEGLKQSAVKKGLMTQEAADALSANEQMSIMFFPGFSTAEKVSDVSGRGVGMDVVKTNIEKLKGQIDIESKIGSGTKIKIRIPLTLAIMQTLLCKVENEKYALPLFSVMETVRLPLDGIEKVSGSSVIRLRDEILPVIFLKELLDVEDSDEVPEKGSPMLDIVIVKVGIKQVGLAVDKTLGQEEILIKPLDVLKGVFEPEYISGATILGDGSMALILDVSDIINVAKLIDTEAAEKLRKSYVPEQEDLVLLLSDGQVEQYGTELRGITKIDIIESDKVEFVGGQEVLKHSGEIIPITRIPYITEFDPPTYNTKLYLVIITNEGRKAGLLTNELKGLKKIARSKITESSGDMSMDRALIINNIVTLILSLDQVFSTAAEKRRKMGFKYSVGGGEIKENVGIKTILVVDDSATHREMVSSTLAEAGYNVLTAEDGEDAMEKIAGADLVVTDLEMPKMDGIAFTAAAKKNYPAMPVIVLTNYSAEEDLTRAFNAGADHFLVKFNPESLLETISKSHWYGE